jgi:phenylpropionate dioxygenase-like ring-hydroxylating dioxygenase large terminal subunit
LRAIEPPCLQGLGGFFVCGFGGHCTLQLMLGASKAALGFAAPISGMQEALVVDANGRLWRINACWPSTQRMYSSPNADLTWWHPVADARTPLEAPSRVTLLGQDLVLWRDDAGQAAAFVDRCPHRGARLSLGRVSDGLLECPYHGWRFGRDGRCRHIPAAPDFDPPQRAQAFGLREAHGLWWVGAPGAVHEAPPLAGLPPRRVLCGPYAVATSAPRVVENFLDTAHFGLVHEGSLGDRGHLEVPAYQVSHDPQGRPGVEHYRAWQPRASALAAGGAWVDYAYQVLAPFCAQLVKRAVATDAYVLFACPIDDEHCTVWFLLCTSDERTPDAELRAFQNAVFAEDRPILESQRPRRLPLAAGELHGPADRLSLAYRRWLAQAGVQCGVLREPERPA